MSDPGPRASLAQPFATGLRAWVAVVKAVLKTLLKPVLLALLLAALLAVSAPALALNDAQQLVVEAWRLVNQSYVDPSQLEAVNWRRLRQKALEKPITNSIQAYEAIESMLDPLADPYTRMLRPSDFGTLRANTQGTVSGVGLQLGLRGDDQRIVVIAPLDDSPAAEAAIGSGTEVVQVNGQMATQLGLEGTAAQLRGASGSEVLLTLQETNGPIREVVLKRRQVELRPVRSRVLQVGDHRLGYLRITQFSEAVPQLVREALEDLGRSSVDGLILDLRNNSGGLVSAGVAVANAFLDGTPIVVTEDRGGISAQQQANAGTLYDGPLLTMINGGTASASEILAGALQDNGLAQLVGSRSFGKGLIQTLISLGDGSGLAVTVARYLTPSGHDIQNRGLDPDVGLTPPEPLNPGGPGDTWLEQAQALMATQLAQGQT